MKTSRLIPVLACLVLVASSLGVVEAADAVKEANALLRQGNEFRRQGQHEKALEAFRKAHEAHPSALTSAELGLVLHDLGRWVESEVNLTEALSTTDPWIQKNRRDLEDMLKKVRSHIGEITVEGSPGAEVRVDDLDRGQLPLKRPVRVGEGDHLVDVSGDGFVPSRQRVRVKASETVAVRAELTPVRPLPAPPAVAASPLLPPAAPAAAGGTQLVKGSPEARPEGEGKGPSVLKMAGMGVLAASVAALGTGIGFLVVHHRGTCDPPAGGVCPERYNTALQGWLLVGAGVAGGAAGALMLYKSSSASVSLSAMGVSGRF